MSFRRLRDFGNTLEQQRVRMDGKSSDSRDLDITPRSSNKYERYKRSLHAIFDGKAPLPDHLRIDQKDESDDGCLDNSNQDTRQMPSKNTNSRLRSRRLQSAGMSLCQEHMSKIASAITPSEINLALDSFFSSGFELPKEEEVLSKALVHRDDSVVQKALISLTDILKKVPSKSPRLLKSRVQNASLMAHTKKTHALCLEALAALTFEAA